MVYAGKFLSNYNQIKDYNLKNDSVVHLVLKLRGGPPEYNIPIILEDKKDYFSFDNCYISLHKFVYYLDIN